MKSTKKLKVFGGSIFQTANGKYRQYRTLVCAYTKKQAAEILNIPSSQFSSLFCETANILELSVATEIGTWVLTEKIAKSSNDFKRIK